MKHVPQLLYSILLSLIYGVSIAGPGDGPPPPGVPPPPGFPLDGNIIILTLAALVFGIYSVQNFRVKKKAD
jgi:hypothetical protein